MEALLYKLSDIFKRIHPQNVKNSIKPSLNCLRVTNLLLATTMVEDDKGDVMTGDGGGAWRGNGCLVAYGDYWLMDNLNS